MSNDHASNRNDDHSVYLCKYDLSHVYEYLYSACQMIMQAIVMMTTLCICANMISKYHLYRCSACQVLSCWGACRVLCQRKRLSVCISVEVKCVHICLCLCLSSVTMSVSVDVVSASMQYQCLHISKPGSLNKMHLFTHAFTHAHSTCKHTHMHTTTRPTRKQSHINRHR